MINIGDVNIGNEIILNSFQSQVYSETLKKLEQFLKKKMQSIFNQIIPRWRCHY